MVKRRQDEDPTQEQPSPAADDPDRAAILARRQRFIALALSGLATAGCDKPSDGGTKPDPKTQQDIDEDPRACLKIEVAEDPDVGQPQPCLKVVAPDPGEDDAGQPQPCLKVVAPDPEPGEDDAGQPQPCLMVVAPEPEEPKPQPCLRVAKPPEDPPTEPAKPQPCLKVAKPD